MNETERFIRRAMLIVAMYFASSPIPFSIIRHTPFAPRTTIKPPADTISITC